LPPLSPALVQFGLARADIAQRARPVRVVAGPGEIAVGF